MRLGSPLPRYATAHVHTRGACVLLSLLLLAGIAGAGELLDERMQMELHHIDTGYTFDVWLTTPLAADTLLRLLNDTATVRKLTSFVDSVHIREIDSTAYEIYSRFSYLGYRGETRFLRRIFPQRDSIAITLQAFRHNWRLIPQVDRVEAFYTLDDRDSVRLVHFSQTVILDRSVGRIYMRLVRWRLRRFAETLLEDIVVPAERRSRGR